MSIEINVSKSPHSSGVQCGVRTNPGGARCSAYVAGGSNDGKIV